MATTPLNNVPPIGSMTGKGLGQSAQSKNHEGTTPWRRGHLSRMDEIPHGDPATAAAISEYGDYVDTNRSSQRWAACHVAGTKILLPDGTSRSIESFRRGDSVQCPNGATKVKEVVEYQYDKLMTLFVDGHFPVDSTPEHEYLVIRKEKVLDQKRRLSSSFIYKAVPSSFVEKIQVKDIRPGDYVVSGFKRDRSLEPKLLLRKYISEPEHYGRNRSILPEVVQLDRDLLRVFGLYLGDGTANFKNGVIKFTFGLHELHLAEEVQAIIQKVFGVPCKIKTESNVIRVLAWSRSLVEFFINLLGGGKAAPKKIHPDIFNANIDLWPIITGICDADGCGPGNSILKKPALSQKYQGLILQLRAISFDRGTRCHLSDWDRGKYGISYKLYWGNYATCSRKRFKITDGTFAFIVKNVESKDFEGSVYSLEVEDDSHVYQLSTCLHSGNTVQHVENILFGSGRQYIDDILANRITNNASSTDISIVRDTLDNIPRPVNDLLGRYIETNIALFTENKPMPRVEPKSDNIADQKAAELSMLTLEHLWEALEMPEKNREIARLMLYTGTAWKEIVWDESIPRRVSVPQTETSPTSQIIGPDGTPVSVPVPRQIQKFNRDGTLATTTKVEYGDLTARIVSAFEMHIPVTHHWDEIDWIMREYYMPIDSLKSQYETAWKRKKNVFTKKNGWFLDNLEKIASENVTRLPLWWWERLSTLVEGPGQSLYIGSPEQWDGYAIVRIFDRKPNELWPKGRTVITAGNQVLYDSPPDRGARAYDPRWPERWHPYIRFRWEPMVGSIWGRSLVSKLLPKLKRVNAIDTTLIMWRRTIPMSAWISPKGCGKSGTYVLSCESKTVRIEDIKIGDVVQTKTGTGKVLQKFEYDNDEQLYKIRAKGLLPIEFTGNHLIPVIPKEALQKVKRSHTKPYVHNYNVITNQDIVEKAVEEIKVGDLVLSQFSRGRDGIEKLDLSVYINGYKFLRNPVPKYVEIDKDLLRLLGLYLAEGSTGNNCSLKWTVGLHEKDTLGQEIKNLVFKIFGLNTPFEESHGNGSRLQVWLSSSPIRDLFLALAGRGAPNKRIASEIFNYPGSLLPLVGGLIDGDGSSQEVPQSKDGRTRTWKQSRYYTTSRDLAYQVRGILLDEKIPCSMSVDRKNRNHPKYILNFDSTAREQLAPYCNKFRELSYQKTARQGFWVDKFFCSPIKKIEKVDYTGKVYDLEIEGDHYYQASGIVVHNSHPQKDLWCLPGDSKVVTDAGTKDIRDIQIGDTVYSNGKYAKVEQVYKNGLRNDFTSIKAIGNPDLKMTSNHRLPVLREGAIKEVCAKDVVPGDYLICWAHRPRNYSTTLDMLDFIDVEEVRTKDSCIIRYRTPKARTKWFSTLNMSTSLVLTEDLLWLIGLYLAEGCASHKQLRFDLHINETDLEEKIRHIVEKTFGVVPTVSVHEDRNSRTVLVGNAIVATLFKKFVPGVAKTKFLCREIFESKASLLPLVAGWLDGDGSYSKNRGMRGGTSSVSLTEQIRLITLNEGIITKKYKNVRPEREHKVRGVLKTFPKSTMWELRFNSDCTKLSSYTVRFNGKDGLKQKTKMGIFADGDYWFFKVRSITTGIQEEAEEVFDLSTSTGHYNVSATIVHNSGRPGLIWEYDPRQTAGMAPEVVHPPAYPEAALREREQQLQEMEFIAGTEQVLRGERPSGVNSAAALDILRKQALSSRSAILQAWDESLQKEGTAILQEVIKHVRSDPRYLERIRILAREKASALTIHNFSGEDLSDNVIVRVDTMSQALLSKEAKEAKTLEFLQYAGNLMQLPFQLQQSLLDRLGIDYPMQPQGIDVERIRRMISWIKMGDFRRVIPMAEDDPFIAYELLVQETKKDSWWDLSPDQQNLIFQLMDKYKQMIEFRMIQQQLAQQGGAPPEGGGQGGAPQGGGAQGGAGPV